VGAWWTLAEGPGPRRAQAAVAGARTLNKISVVLTCILVLVVETALHVSREVLHCIWLTSRYA
jgi:hypothetical protein